jgi:hypothetical protein
VGIKRTFVPEFGGVRGGAYYREERAVEEGADLGFHGGGCGELIDARELVGVMGLKPRSV